MRFYCGALLIGGLSFWLLPWALHTVSPSQQHGFHLRFDATHDFVFASVLKAHLVGVPAQCWLVVRYLRLQHSLKQQATNKSYFGWPVRESYEALLMAPLFSYRNLHNVYKLWNFAAHGVLFVHILKDLCKSSCDHYFGPTPLCPIQTVRSSVGI